MAQAIAMQKLERVTDVDIAEVHESKTLFDGIEQETQPLNTFIKILYALDWQKLDKDDQTAVRAWLDGQFGEPFDIVRGKFRLGAADEGTGHPEAKDILGRVPEKMVKSAERFATILNRARALIGTERFQNWQVSFPGVWKQWESAELIGGFDAVIGNPPYVRQELIKDYKPALKRAFAATYDGSADLYVYFYEQGLTLLRPGGRLSYVVTNKWMRVGYADALRDLFGKSAWIEFVAVLWACEEVFSRRRRFSIRYRRQEAEWRPGACRHQRLCYPAGRRSGKGARRGGGESNLCAAAQLFHQRPLGA
jgi:hypothetical protein